MKLYESWGRFPTAPPREAWPVYWQDAVPDLSNRDAPVLPYGLGRSYGDVCLNRDGYLLDTSPLDRFLHFDAENGLLRCESGTSLDSILRLIVPKGWFLPVTPGTRFVTVGGAIANDVHGKNHHVDGTFGRHVARFELLRSSGERLICSPSENPGLFAATIGGLGLTGLVLWAEIRLRPIRGPLIDADTIRFASLDNFFELSAESGQTHQYTVAWIDCLAKGKRLGRGLFMRGNHADIQKDKDPQRALLSMPFNAPPALLNRGTIAAFNTLYYRGRPARVEHRLVLYAPFFYPLDAVAHWNRIYGKRGFLQYQFVVPFADGRDAIRSILDRIARSGRSSFLAVLKVFGDVPSPGMLSFPRPGVTLALDFPYSPATVDLLRELDVTVREAGGALYPAKDACMIPETFAAGYPNWREFVPFIDPAFSSSFWRRMGFGHAQSQ